MDTDASVVATDVGKITTNKKLLMIKHLLHLSPFVEEVVGTEDMIKLLDMDAFVDN
jgi:hypothetical protein